MAANRLAILTLALLAAFVVSVAYLTTDLIYLAIVAGTHMENSRPSVVASSRTRSSSVIVCVVIAAMFAPHAASPDDADREATK